MHNICEFYFFGIFVSNILGCKQIKILENLIKPIKD